MSAIYVGLVVKKNCKDSPQKSKSGLISIYALVTLKAEYCFHFTALSRNNSVFI